MKHYYFTLFFSLFLFSAFAQDIELKSINKKEKEAEEVAEEVNESTKKLVFLSNTPLVTPKIV